jgi:hypothetical protein
MPKITVTEIVGASTVVTVKFTVDGKPGSGKAFKNEYQKETPAFVVGESYDVEFEKKQDRDGNDEAWIKKARSPFKGGAGGGGRAPDPERAKNDRERLNLEKEKQPLIMAQFVLGQAVQIAINRSVSDSSFKLTTPAIQAIAVDLVAVLEETHGEIARRFEIA